MQNHHVLLAIAIEKVRDEFPEGVILHRTPEGQSIFPVYGSDGGITARFSCLVIKGKTSQSVKFDHDIAPDDLRDKLLTAAREIA